MSKKIILYTQHDIDVIGDNIDILQNEADMIVKTKYEPTIYEFRSVIKIVEQFIKSKGRILYGGTALNKLVIAKDKKQAIYGEFDKPDIEFYSPEPLKDLKELCDILGKKYKYVQGQQAQHGETYKFFVNFDELGDITYVPPNIFSKLPYMEIDGLKVIHPKFMFIDYLRMYTDPMMSFRRLEKAVPRGMKLINNYPLEVGIEPIKYDELGVSEENIIKDISLLLNKSNSIIHVGSYTIQFYTINKDKKILPYEVISTDYKKDVNDFYKELSKKYKVTFREYYPYFQFWDSHLEFLFNNKVVLTVFKNYDRCIPYRKYDSGNIASFQQVLLHHLIKYYYNNNMNIPTDNVNNIIGAIVNSRNEYLKKHNKTVMDDTIFREFQINCLGKAIDSRRQHFLDMTRKRDQGKQALYRYNPKTDHDHKVPNYIFDNTTGSRIQNSNHYSIYVMNDSSDSSRSNDSSRSSYSSDSSDSSDSSESNEYPSQNLKRNEDSIDYTMI